jgi:ParB family transcriptional regulator, chromosome partitioning protein
VNEQQVESILISEIRITNPRSRNRLKWQLVVQSIATVGLKRPITVARRPHSNSDGKRYDLVCGQGRMEAFVELGEMFIPAIITEAPEQDRQLMSLVENIARRPASTHAILFEVRVLRERGHSSEQIARKLGLDRAYLYGICNLIDKGEEFLVSSVEAGRIPLSVAVEIATGNNHEISRALSEAYEKGDLRGARISAARRVISQRLERQRLQGKTAPTRRKLTGEALVQEYKQKIREQTALVVKANRTRDRLILLTSAVRILFADENFRTLLKAEGVQSVPAELAGRIQQ